jgi:putative transposase
MYYYKKQKDDSPVIEQLEILAEKHPTKGFTDYYHRIRNKGYKWNHKRIKRVYQAQTQKAIARTSKTTASANHSNE